MQESEDLQSGTNPATKLPGGILGLKNLGNTCYLNCVIQALCHLPELKEYIISGKFQKDLQDSKVNLKSKDTYNLAEAFGTLIKTMWFPTQNLLDQRFISPFELRNCLVKLFPEFNNNNQQDAHEVLTLILDTLSSGLSREGNANNSIIIDLFFGRMKTITRCKKCGKTFNENIEPFSSLELATPNEYKISLLFVPIKKGFPVHQLYLMVHENLQFKNILAKVKKIAGYNFNMGTFYFVKDNNVEKIVNLEEKCDDLTKNISSLFLIENNEFAKAETKTKFFTSLNFKVIEDKEKGIKDLEVHLSFPRIFPFYPLEEPATTWIYSSIFSQLNEYIDNFAVTEREKNKDSIYFTVLSDKTPKGVYKCFICEKEDESHFDCKCINDILLTKAHDFETNNHIKSFIENLKESYLMKVTAHLSHEIIKIKELNRCLEDEFQKVSPEKELNIYDLCDFFFSEEKIDIDTTCSCKEKSPHLKKMEISTFPKILLVHLKRFKNKKNNDKKVFGEKNEVPINFKQELNLSKYGLDGEKGKYELCSVIYHKGKINVGHYTTVCKHFEIGWINFDDKNVSIDETSKSPLQKENAYILFFRRV